MVRCILMRPERRDCRELVCVFVEVQEILGKLSSSDDLLSLWNATYEVASSMRDHYATLIALQHQQAKQNRILTVTHSRIESSRESLDG